MALSALSPGAGGTSLHQDRVELTAREAHPTARAGQGRAAGDRWLGLQARALACLCHTPVSLTLVAGLGGGGSTLEKSWEGREGCWHQNWLGLLHTTCPDMRQLEPHLHSLGPSPWGRSPGVPPCPCKTLAHSQPDLHTSRDGVLTTEQAACPTAQLWDAEGEDSSLNCWVFKSSSQAATGCAGWGPCLSREVQLIWQLLWSTCECKAQPGDRAMETGGAGILKGPI